jgi:transposase
LAFATEVRDFPRDKLVYVDETGVNLAMAMRYSRAPRGERAFGRVPGTRGTNISVMAAIRESAVMTWRPVDGSVDGDRFVAFVVDHLAPLLNKGDIVLMDNARIHKSEEVRAAIEAVGARLFFTPPYSPEMNAIEEVFSVVKGVLRKIGARAVGSLVDALRTAFAISTRVLRNFVTHALECAAQLL